MGDTITTGGGIQTVTPVNPGFDRRHWRDRDATGWPTLRIETREGVNTCRRWMGLPPLIESVRATPIEFRVEPEAAQVIITGWDTAAQTGDERLLEVLCRHPAPIYFKRGDPLAI